ncbi:MAG: hypothetical protein U1F43_25430 [Myxococcota bacterium]
MRASAAGGRVSDSSSARARAQGEEALQLGRVDAAGLGLEARGEHLRRQPIGRAFGVEAGERQAHVGAEDADDVGHRAIELAGSFSAWKSGAGASNQALVS